MRRQRSSRLSRTNERQNKRQALVFAISTVVIIFLLIQFGPYLINLFGNAVYTLRGGDSADSRVESGDEIFQAPIMLDHLEATQSAVVAISGIAPEDNGTIEIYVNNRLEDEVDLSDSPDFNADVPLRKGNNTIKTRYIKGEQKSPYSEELTIRYTTEKPEIEISSPQDNQTFTRADKSINVTGKTDPENTVSVNSFRAIVDSEGNFSYLLSLNDGENTIVVEAKSPTGITTQKSIKVIYQP